MRDWLNPSIEKTNGTHTEEDVFCMCATGQLKLWKFERSAAITEFTIYPRMKVLNLFLVGGDLEELKEKETTMIAYAKENGCTRITGGGRAGWARTPHPDGWKFNCTSMYKDVL